MTFVAQLLQPGWADPVDFGELVDGGEPAVTLAPVEYRFRGNRADARQGFSSVCDAVLRFTVPAAPVGKPPSADAVESPAAEGVPVEPGPTTALRIDIRRCARHSRRAPDPHPAGPERG